MKSKSSLLPEGKHNGYVNSAIKGPTKQGNAERLEISVTAYAGGFARAWLHEKQYGNFLKQAGIPGVVPADIIGRSLSFEVYHQSNPAGTSVFANVNIHSIEFENEPAPPPETKLLDNQLTILVTAVHPRWGTEATGTAFYRVVGTSKIITEDVPSITSPFHAAKKCVLDLLARAKEKSQSIKIVTDIEPVTKAHDIEAAADAILTLPECSVVFQPGADLKRRLFRRLPPFQAPTTARKPQETDPAQSDWLNEALS